MDDYWLSTKSPRQMLRPSYQNVKNDQFLRDHAGIDSALLAADLGISEIHVQAYQRQLGLRTFTRNPDRKT